MKKVLLIILVILVLAGVSYMGYELYLQRLEISALAQEKQDARNELTQAQDQINNLESEKSGLQDKIADLNSQIRDKESELSTLKDRVICAGQPSIELSYTSNSTASRKLRGYVGEVVGSVDSAEWEIIWSDSKTAIHYLASGEYLVAFIVYFDDANIEKGIFWVHRQCWLNEK